MTLKTTTMNLLLMLMLLLLVTSSPFCYWFNIITIYYNYMLYFQLVCHVA